VAFLLALYFRNDPQQGRGGGAKGVDDVPAGYWEVDHIVQISKEARAPSTTACQPASAATDFGGTDPANMREPR